MKKLLHFSSIIPFDDSDNHASLPEYWMHSPEAICALTKDDEIWFVNPSFEKLLSESIEEFVEILSNELDPFAESMTSLHDGIQVRLQPSNRLFQLMPVPISVHPEITLVFSVMERTYENELAQERMRFDAYRQVFGDIHGLALFEFNLETHYFETFGSLKNMFGLSTISSDTHTPLLFKQLLHPDDLNVYLKILGELMIDPEIEMRESVVRIFHLEESQYHHYVVRSHLSMDRKLLTCAVMDQSVYQTDNEKIEKFNQFIEAGMMEFDFQSDTFQHVSPGLFRMIGFEIEPSDITLEFWKQFLHPEDLELLTSSRHETLQGESATYIYRVYVKDELKWVEEKREPIWDQNKNVTGYRSYLKNITRLQEQEQEITTLRTVDPITGIANRDTLKTHIEELLEEAQSVTMIGISFNHYAEVKQTLGFELADEWNAVTIGTLQPYVPDDALLAVIHEDLYCIVIPSYWTDERVRRFGEKLTTLSERAYSISEYEIFPHVSVGVCRSPHDGMTANELIAHTVQVTNHAYTQGHSNLAFYSSSVDLPSLRRYTLINDLRTAIKNRELFVVYQPKVHAWTGEIVGAEALMRWTHPTWGPISPAEFIPLIEHNQQIVELTDFLIEEVCRFMNQLPTCIPISINIPASYFYLDNYMQQIQQSYTRHNILPHYLEIEIPESTLLENRDRMKSVFETLNAFGITVSFDDFGTGYSSLAYVQDYNIQIMKIDRIFAHGIHQNVKSQAIVRSLMYIAKEFGMDIVVEGVECFRDLNWLRDHGVQTIQGYLFSPPVESEQMIRLLDQTYLPPTEVSSLEGHTMLIPVQMIFSRIQSFTSDLGRAPALVSMEDRKSFKLYTTLFLPPNDFLQFSILMKSQDQPIPVNIIGTPDFEDGIYTYELEPIEQSLLEGATEHAFHLTPEQAKNTLHLHHFL